MDHNTRKAGSSSNEKTRIKSVPKRLLNCYYTNANSLYNKLTELKHFVEDNDYDILDISETWAKPTTLDPEYEIEGFRFCRKDGTSGHGGVMLYIRHGLKPVLYSELANSGFQDSIWSLIKDEKGEKILIRTIYRSPNSSDSNSEKLLNLLTKASEMKDVSRLIVMGDFNMPDIDYESFHVNGDENSYQGRFFDLTQDLFLIQNVFNCTRIRQGQLPSKLDYVFLVNENEVENLQYLNPIGLSDHVGIQWKLNCRAGIEDRRTTLRYAYWKADYDEMERRLNEINWSEVLNNYGVEEMWRKIREVYQDLINTCVPLLRHHNKKKLPFMSKETKKLINKRERLFRIYSKTKRDIDFSSYKKIRNAVNSAIRKEKLQETERKCGIFKTNKKAFYGFIRSKQRLSKSNLYLKISDVNITETAEEAANEFSKYFGSVYTDENTAEIPEFEPVDQEKPDNITNIVVTEDEVYKCLQKLMEEKSPGPDGMHPMILKRLAKNWTQPLTILFQKSLETGSLPGDWKRANVTPIHKKGSKSEVENYRPVALTSLPCKLLETIIKNRMLSHIEINNLFTQHQHGFTRNRSCLTNLLETLEDWTSTLEKGYGLDVLYMDYQKAFDTVPHQRLMEKLNWYGVTGSLRSWILDFVSGRVMKVVVDGSSSS